MKIFDELKKTDTLTIEWEVEEDKGRYVKTTTLYAGDIAVARWYYNGSRSKGDTDNIYRLDSFFSGKSYYAKTEEGLIPDIKMVQNSFIKKITKGRK